MCFVLPVAIVLVQSYNWKLLV